MDISQWFQGFLQSALDFIPHLIVGLVIFAISILLARPASRWVNKRLSEKISDVSLTNVLSRATRWVIVIIGIVVALEQVNFNVTGFVAGLGIAGLTIGFALQDITRNFIAGIILMTRKPFTIGDAVELSGYSGSVLSINSRDTVIKTWDGEVVILPNLNIFNSAIINYTDAQYRRRKVSIGLGYEEDPAKASQIFQEAIQGVEGVAGDPAPSVLADTLGSSTLNLVAYFWVDQKNYPLFTVHANVIMAIMKAADRENINLPYPIQTVRITSENNTPPGQGD